MSGYVWGAQGCLWVGATVWGCAWLFTGVPRCVWVCAWAEYAWVCFGQQMCVCVFRCVYASIVGLLG